MGNSSWFVACSGATTGDKTLASTENPLFVDAHTDPSRCSRVGTENFHRSNCPIAVFPRKRDQRGTDSSVISQ